MSGQDQFKEKMDELGAGFDGASQGVNERWGAMKTPCKSDSLQVVHYDDSDCGPGGQPGT